MIRNKFFIYAAVFFFTIISTVPAIGADTKSIDWQPYEAGIQKIKDQNKKGFLHFYTDWCAYCKIMNRQTFSDAKIIAYLNENFVPIRINAEKQRGVARKYGVNRFPDTWFLSEDSSNLSSQPGFISADMLLAILTFLNTDSYNKMRFSEWVEKEYKQKKETEPEKAVSQKAAEKANQGPVLK
jgi:thioredoxin-related protein